MYYRKPVAIDAKIPNAGTTSGVLHLGDNMLVGLILPGTLTSSTITFEASDKQDGTFVPVYESDGTQVSVTVAASRAVGLTAAQADAMCAWESIKIVTGSAEAAERIIILVKK